MEPILPPYESPRPSEKNAPLSRGLAVPFILSILIAGIAGAVMGVVSTHGQVGSWIEKTLYPNGTTSTVSRGVTQLSVEEESATIEVVKKASDSVVSVIGTKDFSKVFQDRTPFDFFGFSAPQPTGKQQVSAGSGFIISSDGLILTNKHVIADEQTDYTVVLNDKRTLAAKVLAQDPVNDIAILKVDATNLPTLTLGDSDTAQVGQTVIAIGNALGQYRNTVTKGIISGKSRTVQARDGSGSSETLQDVFQTDAAINPGNSGGPLLDLAGSVIGINTAVNTSGQLIGFALPINIAKRDVESVQRSGKIEVAYLGVCHSLITKEVAERNNLTVDYGALVVKGTGCDFAVVPGSPADKAGLVENDIVLEVNGTKIEEDHALVSLLAAFKPGDEVTMKIQHKGETKEVKVTLGART